MWVDVYASRRYRAPVFIRHALAVGLSGFVLAVFAGCSGAPAPDPNAPDPKAPISIDTWCSTVTSRLCDRTAATCHNGAVEFANSCKDNGIANCNAGREPTTPSGRTKGELDACLARLDPLSCPELQGMTKNPDLMAACSLGASAPSDTPPPATAAATAAPASPTAAPASPTAAPASPTP